MSILSLVREILTYVLEIVRDFATSQEDKSNFRGEIMYIVKADNPDVGFSIAFDATDSEGNMVPEDSLMVEIVSDNEDSVSVDVDETGLAGTVHFGSPGLANLNVTVEDADGDMLGSFGAQFTVTVGDASAIVGGSLVFEGLSEAPAPEVPAEPAPPVEEEPTTPVEEPPVTETPTGEPVEDMPTEELPAPSEEEPTV